MFSRTSTTTNMHNNELVAYQGSMNPGSSFGSGNYSKDEQARIQNLLQTRLPSDQMAQRSGPGNQKLTYVESWRSIELANEIFGFSGWSSTILSMDIDFIDEKNSRYTVGVSAICRVTLKDGASHEDVGYGQADNLRDKGKAIEKAKKSAVSDARKRALRVFGEHLGNCVYNKEHVKEARKQERVSKLHGNHSRVGGAKPCSATRAAVTSIGAKPPGNAGGENRGSIANATSTPAGAEQKKRQQLQQKAHQQKQLYKQQQQQKAQQQRMQQQRMHQQQNQQCNNNNNRQQPQYTSGKQQQQPPQQHTQLAAVGSKSAYQTNPSHQVSKQPHQSMPIQQGQHHHHHQVQHQPNCLPAANATAASAGSHDLFSNATEDQSLLMAVEQIEKKQRLQ